MDVWYGSCVMTRGYIKALGKLTLNASRCPLLSLQMTIPYLLGSISLRSTVKLENSKAISFRRSFVSSSSKKVTAISTFGTVLSVCVRP